MAGIHITEAQILEMYKRIQDNMDFPYNLKTEQVKVIEGVLNGNHSFAILPTGYGKSMCFGLPPLIMDQITPSQKHMALVISPLRSLMINQAQNWNKRGVTAVTILKVTEMSADEIDQIERGHYSIMFASPESLMQKRWLNLARKFASQIVVVACDEVHCLIQWGDTFRESYKKVSLLRSHLTNVPFLLLTATCTESMRKQLCHELLLSDTEVTTIAILPDRPNVFLHFHANVKYFQTELQWLVDHLSKGREADNI